MWGAAVTLAPQGPTLRAGLLLGNSDRQPMVGHDPKEHDVGGEREQSESRQRSSLARCRVLLWGYVEGNQDADSDYGIRWSFMPAAWLADNKLAAFVPSAYDPLSALPLQRHCAGRRSANGCAALGVAGGVYSKNRSIIPSNNHLIAPRVGFAWDVFAMEIGSCARELGSSSLAIRSAARAPGW